MCSCEMLLDEPCKEMYRIRLLCHGIILLMMLRGHVLKGG